MYKYTADCWVVLTLSSWRMAHQTFRLLMHNMSHTLSITKPNASHSKSPPSHHTSLSKFAMHALSFYIGLNKSQNEFVLLSEIPKLYAFFLSDCRLSTAWIHTHWWNIFLNDLGLVCQIDRYFSCFLATHIHTHTTKLMDTPAEHTTHRARCGWKNTHVCSFIS